MTKVLNIGDKLVCNVDGGEWYDHVTKEDADGPPAGEVVTVRAIGADFEAFHEGQWEPTVWLEEYPGDTDDDSFYLSNFHIFSKID